MTSHGVLRQSSAGHRTEEQRQRELQAIRDYQDLDSIVRQERADRTFSKEALDKTSELLIKNPEYYTIWNYRRLILLSLLSEFTESTSSPSDVSSHTQKTIQTDLEFLLPLLQKSPKCYWIWNHRLWLLQEATQRLPANVSRNFWEKELALVGKMLNKDCRNFLGWGYRRDVIASLDPLRHETAETANGEAPKSMTQEELDYTTKMIGTNLSNFSAWHNRSRLILKVLNERAASDVERKQMLDNELALIHRALIDPYDQSLWFYHQYLMCTCDPDTASKTMAPNLTDCDRLGYLEQELSAIEEILEDTTDCKWVYQTLITYSLLVSKIKRQMDDGMLGRLSEWLMELRRLDPLRKGRWDDLEKSLNNLPWMEKSSSPAQQ